MKILKITSSPVFGAKTKIEAPEGMMSKEEINYYEELGKKIGCDEDTISITMCKPYKSKINDNTDVYDITYKTNISKKFDYCKMSVPVKTLPPQHYLDMFFTRRM